MPYANSVTIALRSAGELHDLVESYPRGIQDNKVRRERLIDAKPGFDVDIYVEISTSFKNWTASALLVAIACDGDAGTQFWAVRHNPQVRAAKQYPRGFVFAGLKLPTYTETSRETRSNYDAMSYESACHKDPPQRMRVEQMTSQPHGISIFVQRGHLSRELLDELPADPQSDGAIGSFDPATYKRTRIDPRWFVPLQNEHADLAEVHFLNQRDSASKSRKMPSTLAQAGHKRKAQASSEDGPKKNSRNAGRKTLPVSPWNYGETTDLCEDEDDDEPMKEEQDNIAQARPEQTRVPPMQLSSEPSVEAPTTTAEISSTEGTSTTHTMPNVATAPVVQARKLAQLNMRQQRINLEKRRLELEQQQLELDQERMDIEHGE